MSFLVPSLSYQGNNNLQKHARCQSKALEDRAREGHHIILREPQRDTHFASKQKKPLIAAFYNFKL